MSQLTPRTEEIIERVVAPNVQGEVRSLLQRGCDAQTLACTGWSDEQMERIWFAVLKLGEGKPASVKSAVSLAQTDWRDLLMAAGFGEDEDAHERWWAGVC